MLITTFMEGTTLWYQVLWLAAAPVSLLLATGVNRRIGKATTISLGAQRTERNLTEDRDYVLYLRSFRVDDVLSEQDPIGGRHLLTSLASNFRIRDRGRLNDTWESRLAHLFARFGHVVAVGRPGEPLPPLGARRIYPTDACWQKAVSKAIRQARLVVIAAAADRDSPTAEGTLWEYTEAVRLLQPSQVVLVAFGERDSYEHFRARAARYFAKRAEELRALGKVLPTAPVLPDWPKPARPSKVSNGFPLHGVVRFEDDWTARFVHFDATAETGLTPYARWRATMRTRIEPWLEQCERGLPGEAVHPVRVSWHWHSRLLFGLVLGLLGFSMAAHWGSLEAWQKFSAFGALVFGTLAWWRLNDIEHGADRDIVAIRFPDGEPSGSPKKAPQNSATREYLAVEIVNRWPGPHGIGLTVYRTYHDENREPTNPPFRASLRALTRSELSPLRPCLTWRVSGVSCSR